MRNYEDDLGVIGIIIGVFGLAFGLSQTAKMRSTARKIDMTISEINRSHPIDIKENVIRKAVQTSVDREAKSAITNAVKSIGNHVTNDMDRAIRNDVSKAYNDIRSKVEAKVYKEVGKLDADEIKAGVRKKIEDKMFEEFCKVSGISKMFGYSDDDDDDDGNSPNVDMENLAEVLDAIPYNQRAEVVKTIFGK